jgi:predicted RNA-binding protein with RPS1 domain
MSPDDEQWYPGRIDGQRDSGVWVVAWDDPDGGPETNDLSESNIKKMHFFQDYKVGDDCRAMSPDDENMYPGTVAKILKDGKFLVKWDDPDGGDETSEVHFENMKKVRVKRDYKKGDVVLAMYPDDGDYYEATVVKKNKDGSFKVQWSDPDGGPENSAVHAKEMKIPPITFDELELGQKYQGIISRTDERGFAFVDINAHRHGFLHISRVSNDYVVGSIDEHLEEDQEVTVWISGISDDDSGHFEVSMVEGIMRPPFRSRRSTRDADLTPFADVSQDKWFEGEVARVQPYGAFVEIELESGECAQGLVHVSRMSGDFVSDVTDYVQEGQTVQVRISNVDLERNKIGLTMLEGDGGRREPDDLSAFADLDDSQILDGEVKAIIEPIALVRVKSPDGSASATGSVHITQMSESFVESIEDFVQVGQEVQVRVLDVDMDANKMRLTMMPYEEYEE